MACLESAEPGCWTRELDCEGRTYFWHLWSRRRFWSLLEGAKVLRTQGRKKNRRREEVSLRLLPVFLHFRTCGSRWSCFSTCSFFPTHLRAGRHVSYTVPFVGGTAHRRDAQCASLLAALISRICHRQRADPDASSSSPCLSPSRQTFLSCHSRQVRSQQRVTRYCTMSS